MAARKTTKVGVILFLLITSLAFAASSLTLKVRADDPTTPVTLTLSPTSSSGSWSNENYAYAEGGNSASSSSNGDRSTFWGYGFAISHDATILQVSVRIDAHRYFFGDDQIRLEVYNGYWHTFVPNLSLSASETTVWCNVTSSGGYWSASDVNNIQVRVTHVQVGYTAEKVYLDWVPIEVTYLPAASPTPSPTPCPTPPCTPTPSCVPTPTCTPTPCPTPTCVPTSSPSPISIPPTTPSSIWYVFGNNAIGTSVDTNDANVQSVSYFTCPVSGSVTDIIADIKGASIGNAIAALYSVSDGAALTLLEQSNAVSVGLDFSWVDFQLPSAYPVTQNTTYGLAILGNVPLDIYVLAGTGQRDYNFASFYNQGFANPFGFIGGTSTNGAMSVYATGTVSSTPTPSATPTATPSQTPSPSTTPTPTSIDTPSPIITEAPTQTPAPTSTIATTPTPTPELTSAPSPTPMTTPIPTLAPTPSPTQTPTAPLTQSPYVSPTFTATPQPSIQPESTPNCPTPSPSITQTSNPSQLPSSSSAAGTNSNLNPSSIPPLYAQAIASTPEPTITPEPTPSPTPSYTPAPTITSAFRFGHLAKGNDYSTLRSPGTINLCNYTTTSDTGVIMQISIYLTGTPEGSQVKGLIFANDIDTQLPEGQPLAESLESVNVTSLTGEWYNFTMNFHASQNTMYWFGYSSDGYTRYYFDVGGGSVSVTSQPKNEDSSQFPAAWSYEGKSAMSLYALYSWAPPQPTPTPSLVGSNREQTQSLQDFLPVLAAILAESGIMIAYRIRKKRNFLKKIMTSFAE